MNANQYYFYDLFQKTLRYLVAKALLVKPLTIEEVYEEIDSYDPRYFDFSMESLEANGLVLDEYLKKNFIVEDDVVSLSEKQKEILKEMKIYARESREYQLKRDTNGIKKILNLVKEQKVDSEIPFILFEAFIYEQSNRLDESSLSSMGSLFRFKLYKDKAVAKIDEIKLRALKFCNYPIELIKGISLDFSKYGINSKEILGLKTMSDLLKYKSEFIYFFIYPELEYNLMTLIDLTKDLDDIIGPRIDRFMERYSPSNYYEEYRTRYYKDDYTYEATLEEKEDYYYFMKNALYCWLKDKHDYLIYTFIKRKLDTLGLGRGDLNCHILMNDLGNGLLAFEVMTYIITTDNHIRFDALTDNIFYDINSYEILGIN